MSRLWRHLVLPAAAVVLLTASAAWGHADWQPDQVQGGTQQALTLFVPPEKEGAENARIDVTVLAGWDAPACDAPPGWTCERTLEGAREVVSFVRRVRLAPENRFEVSLQVPDRPGEHVFAVTQTYDDGTGVQWSGPPGDEFEGAVLTVLDPTGARPTAPGSSPSPAAGPRLTARPRAMSTTVPTAPRGGTAQPAASPSASAGKAVRTSATTGAPTPAAAPVLPRRAGRFSVEDVQAAESSTTQSRVAVLTAAALLLTAALGLLAVGLRHVSRRRT